VGRGQHCSQEKIMSILKLRKEGKTYKDIQKTPEYSAKMAAENRGTKVYPFASPREIKSELSDVTIRR